jgi:hypothetical protein
MRRHASSQSLVSAGIKRPQFRRSCSQRKTAIGQDAVPTLYEILNSPWRKPDDSRYDLVLRQLVDLSRTE